MASTYLTRNTGQAGTSGKKFTISFWMKCADVSNSITMFGASSNATGSPFMLIQRTNSGQLRFSDYTNDTTERAEKHTNRLLRDPSAFYHIVIAVDTDQSTASERNRIYINGVEETSFASNTNYSSGATTSMGQNNEMVVGRYEPYNSNYFDGILAHFHYADGQQYAPTVFGETDSVSGIWKPKTAPSVTYGNNGFFLKFENSSNMGTDSSGNSNNFTVSGGTITQNVDTPNNNFATLNPITGATHTGLTIANGNLTIDGNTGTAWRSLMASLGVSSGKWYYECKVKNLGTATRIGLIDVDQMLQANGYFNSLSRGYAYGSNGKKYNNDASTTYGNTYTTNDIIGVAMDLDNGKLYFSKNGTYENSGDPTSGSTGTGSAYDISSGYTYAPSIATYTSTDKLECNFGQGYFGTTQVSSAQADDGGLGIMEYDVPANYRVLCTKNIKDYG